MRHILSGICAVALLSGLIAGFLGCSKALRVCSVSPVDIEEVKADTGDVDVELADVREKLAAAQADLATWQARLADRRAEPPVLNAELVRLKKASGRKQDKPEREATARREADPTDLIRTRRPAGGGDE